MSLLNTEELKKQIAKGSLSGDDRRYICQSISFLEDFSARELENDAGLSASIFPNNSQAYIYACASPFFSLTLNSAGSSTISTTNAVLRIMMGLMDFLSLLCTLG